MLDPVCGPGWVLHPAANTAVQQSAFGWTDRTTLGRWHPLHPQLTLPISSSTTRVTRLKRFSSSSPSCKGKGLHGDTWSYPLCCRWNPMSSQHKQWQLLCQASEQTMYICHCWRICVIWTDTDGYPFYPSRRPRAFLAPPNLTLRVQSLLLPLLRPAQKTQLCKLQHVGTT